MNNKNSIKKLNFMCKIIFYLIKRNLSNSINTYDYLQIDKYTMLTKPSVNMRQVWRHFYPTRQVTGTTTHARKLTPFVAQCLFLFN